MYIKIFIDNLIPALISAGVSLLFSIIYFFGRKIYSCYTRHKEFKMYKKYLIEFLENYLYFLDKERFKYYEKEYEMDSLSIIYYPSFDIAERIISISLAPLVVLSLFKENKIYQMRKRVFFQILFLRHLNIVKFLFWIVNYQW